MPQKFSPLRHITKSLLLLTLLCLFTPNQETRAMDATTKPAPPSAPIAAPSTPNIILYVDATKGRGRYSGTLPAPNAADNDGPFGALSEARDKVRELKASGRLTAPVTVYLRGGHFPLNDTLTFSPDDTAPVTYTSYPGESAIIDGGRRITNWQTTTVNGKSAWVADLPEVKSGRWYFRQLFVDDRRAPRATLPKDGKFYTVVAPAPQYQVAVTNMGSITNAFVAPPDVFNPNWKNLTDVDVVLLHFWCEERSPIVSYDAATNTVVLSRIPTQPIGDGKKYPHPRFYVENVFEALTEPGEWYLDRPTGKLYYIPRPGEDMKTTEIIASRVTHLIKITGKPSDKSYVQFLNFKNLTFAHGDWVQPTNTASWMGRPDLTLASGGQGASALPGNIQLIGARACAFENCKFEHMGMYAIELAEGCTGNRIVGNDMSDLGGGGIKINGAGYDKPLTDLTGNNRVTDNHIHIGGRIFPSASGIMSMNSADNTFSHNEIDDFYYTAIGVGWVWGYADSVSHNNMIEKNHIHNIGQGLVGDMAAIYTLGNQTGTIIRGNLIHDLTHDCHCIYPDEGSSYLTVENNICYDLSDPAFFEHYGRENIVRNNIFALAGTGVITLCKGGDRNSFTLERNILLTKGVPVYKAHYAIKFQEPAQFSADLNCIWDLDKPVPVIAQNYKDDTRTFDWAQWHALGYDLHSIIADPKFKDPTHGDFTLAADSPALALGFKPIDMSDVGPRPTEKRD